MIPVVGYLLKKLQEDYESPSAYGRYIEPGTVIRCDGTDRNHPDHSDLSAIFVSFPYLDIGSWRPPDPPKDESMHLSRGLFQASYTQENALERESEQMFRKIKGIKTDQYLRVPQLWALVLQSETIITCGPSALKEMFEETIQFVEEDAVSTRGPSLVQVTDVLKRVTYIPIDRCKTFLVLKQSIEEECLSDVEYGITDCILHSGSSEEELDGSEWPGLLNVSSTFVQVRLSRKKVDEKSARKHDDTLILEAPKTTRLIEYAGLSSDESDEERDKKALTLIQPRKSAMARETDYSEAAEATRQRLESAGYVVNKPKSLERDEDSGFGTKNAKGKVFKRPTPDEASVWDREMAPGMHSSQGKLLGDIPDSDPVTSASRGKYLTGFRLLEAPPENDDTTPKNIKGQVKEEKSSTDQYTSYLFTDRTGNPEEILIRRRGPSVPSGNNERISPSNESFEPSPPPPQPLRHEASHSDDRSVSVRSSSSDYRRRSVSRSPTRHRPHLRSLPEPSDQKAQDEHSESKDSESEHLATLEQLGNDVPDSKSDGSWSSTKSSAGPRSRQHSPSSTADRGSSASPVNHEHVGSDRLSISSLHSSVHRDDDLVEESEVRRRFIIDNVNDTASHAQNTTEASQVEAQPTVGSDEDEESEAKSRPSEERIRSPSEERIHPFGEERIHSYRDNWAEAEASELRRCILNGIMEATASVKKRNIGQEEEGYWDIIEEEVRGRVMKLGIRGRYIRAMVDAQKAFSTTTSDLHENLSDVINRKEKEEEDLLEGLQAEERIALRFQEEERADQRKEYDTWLQNRPLRPVEEEEVWRQRQNIAEIEDEIESSRKRRAYEERHKPSTMPRDTSAPAPIQTHVPTYPKIHRKFLDVETLLYYDLPWEYAENQPDYIVILREMNQKETDILFEHTRRLRQSVSNRMLIEDRRGERKEHAFVDRHGRSGRLDTPKDPYRRAEPNNAARKRSERGRARDKNWARDRKKTDVRDVSPPPPLKQPNVKLQVPPFLAWPSDARDNEKDVSSATSDGHLAPTLRSVFHIAFQGCNLHHVTKDWHS
jgi:hypothetical protein